MRSQPLPSDAAPDAIDAAWDASPAAAVPESQPEHLDLVNGKTAFSAEWRSAEHTRYVNAIEEAEAARRALHTRWRDLDPSVEEWARRTTWLTAVWAEGLGYRGGATQGVGLALGRLREARGELSGELTVERDGMHLLAQRFSVSSGTARAAVARMLADHPFGGEGANRNAIDWREVLEQFCVRVLALERSSSDIEEVGMRELAGAPPRVIEPYLPEAVTLLWAPQGTGKSTIAVGVVLTLEAYAEVIPGWHPTTQCRVLVLDWEASAQEWNDRIRRVADGAGIEPLTVAYRRMRRPLADQVEELAVELDRREIGYLIVDSYEKAAGAAGDATYEDKAARMFAALDRLARPALVLDHIAGEDLKGGVGRVTIKSIGSVLKGAWARATYDLKRDPNLSTDGRAELVLHNVKLNDAERLAPYELAIVSDGNRGPIRFERSRLSSPELIASLPKHEQLRRLLVSGPRPVKELAAGLDVSEGYVRSLVSRYSDFQALPGVGITLVQREVPSDV
jgi:hypothetical protein